MDSRFTLGKNFQKYNSGQLQNNENNLLFELKSKYHLNIKPVLIKIGGIVSILLSTFVFLAEVIGLLNKNFENHFRDFLFNNQSILVKMLWTTLLVYTVFCVHFAIFRFKIAGFYTLHAGH